MNGINKQLKELYESKWDDFSKKINGINNDVLSQEISTNPLLLRIDEQEYLNSDIKIMIFGQETNDWDLDFKNDVEHCLIMYNDFFNTKNCFSKKNKPFWTGYQKFISKLNDASSGKRISSVWNNVIKIGIKGKKGKPNKSIYDIERNFFNIIKDEIQILKPDVLLFLSGPNYDEEIRNSLQNVNFNAIDNNFNIRQMSKLEVIGNNIKAYRTYHPGYLWRIDIDSYFDEIIKDII